MLMARNNKTYELGEKAAEVFAGIVDKFYQTNTANNYISGFFENVYKLLKENENLRKKGVKIEEIWKKILKEDGQNG